MLESILLLLGLLHPMQLSTEVDLLELMDGYNLFLYHDQGKQIQAKREALGMTELQYAEHLGVPLIKLRKWESNQVQIFKSTWEKYFK